MTLSICFQWLFLLLHHMKQKGLQALLKLLASIVLRSNFQRFHFLIYNIFNIFSIFIIFLLLSRWAVSLLCYDICSCVQVHIIQVNSPWPAALRIAAEHYSPLRIWSDLLPMLNVYPGGNPCPANSSFGCNIRNPMSAILWPFVQTVVNGKRPFIVMVYNGSSNCWPKPWP